MGLELKAPENVVLKPIITVFGVGGAGGNAVNNMIRANLQGAKFVVANTDAQALKNSECSNTLQLGAKSTQGLGAGASPDVGKEAAEESENEIQAQLEGSNMVFVTAGMGGGTGTGASPVIARLAREMGILTVGVVTKPFLFEGAKRMRLAEGGLKELQKHVDTLIVIPNQNLFRIATENTGFEDALKIADEVLHLGVRGVTDLITMPGLINLDFADIKTVMSEMGKAMMGTGEAEGEERAIKAAEAAIANPLLDHSSMKGARGVLINITGGDMTLYEVDSAANRIKEEVGETDANIIFGSTFNPEMKGVIRVSVVATGIDAEDAAAARAASEKRSMSFDEQDDADEVNEIDTPQIHDIERQDIDEDMPSGFDEYEDMRADSGLSEGERDSKFEDIAGSMDWTGVSEDENAQQEGAAEAAIPPTGISAGGGNIAAPRRKKQSLLKRMWNSLKTIDQEDEQPQMRAQPNLQQQIRPEQIPSKQSEKQASSETEPPAGSRVEERPNLRGRR